MAAATIAGCPLFPPSWSTNQRVDALPVAPDSAAIVRSIGLDGALKADFGSGLWEGGPIGIPYDVVGAPHAALARALRVRGRVRPRALPDPAGRAIEGGPDADGDRHALLVDRDRCRLYELFALRREGDRWTPARARPGTCGGRACGRPAGRAPTPPGCRSCRCSRATRRSAAGRSATRCG